MTRRRAEPGHARLLATTVGRVQATRIAYRAPQVSNLHPADTLHRTTGQRISTGQLMDTVTAAVRGIRDFYQHQPVAAGVPTDLLVLSIDATGVAMLPTSLRNPAPPSPADPRPLHARLSDSERTGRTGVAVHLAVARALVNVFGRGVPGSRSAVHSLTNCPLRAIRPSAGSVYGWRADSRRSIRKLLLTGGCRSG